MSIETTLNREEKVEERRANSAETGTYVYIPTDPNRQYNVVPNPDIFKRHGNKQSVFGMRLYTARLDAVMNQIEVAKTMGTCGSPTISSWERGHSVPPLREFMRLCTIYNIDPGELLQPEREGERDKVFPNYTAPALP